MGNLNDIIEQVRDTDFTLGETETIAGYEIRIDVDDWSDDPRSWDSDFTMVCGHHNYRLGDEQWSPRYAREYAMYEYFHAMSGLYPDAYDLDEHQLERISEWVEKNVLWLPLYIYEHGGITMKTSSFSCPWDSGMVGFIYITRENARLAYGWQRITKEREEEIYTWMRSDVKVYDQYLRGEVYHVSIEYDGEHLESCGGIYDDYDLTYTKEDYIIPTIEFHFKNREKQRNEKVKTLIRNNVPLLIRQQQLQIA